MPITVNSNPAAAAANFYMSKNNYALQKSINRLSVEVKLYTLMTMLADLQYQ